MSKYESYAIPVRSQKTFKRRLVSHVPSSNKLLKSLNALASCRFCRRSSSTHPLTVAASSRALSCSGRRAESRPCLARALARRFRSASLMTLIRGSVLMIVKGAMPAPESIACLRRGVSSGRVEENSTDFRGEVGRPILVLRDRHSPWINPLRLTRRRNPVCAIAHLRGPGRRPAQPSRRSYSSLTTL